MLSKHRKLSRSWSASPRMRACWLLSKVRTTTLVGRELDHPAVQRECRPKMSPQGLSDLSSTIHSTIFLFLYVHTLHHLILRTAVRCHIPEQRSMRKVVCKRRHVQPDKSRAAVRRPAEDHSQWEAGNSCCSTCTTCTRWPRRRGQGSSWFP